MRSPAPLLVSLLATLALGAAAAACGGGSEPTSATLPTDSTGGPVTPPPPPAWTFCAPEGNVCEFLGLRDVRLAAPNGAAVQQTAYHTVPCATYGFGDQHPAPGQPLHCDYGPIKTATLVNPMPGMGGLAASVTVPLGAPGVDAPRLMTSADAPESTPGSGSFRTTCSPTKFAFDDPIVYPGQPGASHLHVFFGNAAVTAGSTAQSVATSGASTCRGGTLNRTGYWMPALVDSRTGEVQLPDEGVFYYKTGYNIDPKVVRTIPVGLRMIAGNKNATGLQDYVTWECRDRVVENTGAIPTSCPAGDAVRLTIIFPQCWDGKNLDSPDHKSHMAYPIYRNTARASTCPASHPITIPEITEHFDFPVTAASSPAHWRLTSDMYSASLKGGYSAHADWMNGWDAETLNTIVTQCLNRERDCLVGLIGNGTELH
jgi:hypothetical protein